MRKVETILVLLVGAALLFMAAIVGSSVAGAEPAETRWTGVNQGQARLIAGEAGTKVYAAVHIRLEKGWKTYWRIPGEAGVPPDFDWSQSVNLASARVLYPVPKRMKDPIGFSLGYEGEVVLPVEIAAKDTGKPIDLRLKLLYGVCREICIPAEAELELRLDPSTLKGASPAIAAALARVPGRAIAGGPEIKSHALDTSGAKPRLIVEALFPGGTDGADLFIELEGGEYVALPALPPETIGQGLVRFVSTLAGDDVARLRGKTLTFTLAARSGQSETVLRLP